MKFPVSQYRKRKFPEYRKLRVFGKSEQNQPMVKVQNLSEIQQEIAFKVFNFYQLYVETFRATNTVG